MKKGIVYMLTCVCLGSACVMAQPVGNLQRAQKALDGLEREQRIRQRAQGVLSEIALFDDGDMLGRAIVQQRDIVTLGDNFRGEVSSAPGFEIRSVPDSGLAMGQPSLVREIEELKAEIARLRKSRGQGAGVRGQ